MINVRGFNNWATLTLHERWQWGWHQFMMERDTITGFYFIWGSVEVIGRSFQIFNPDLTLTWLWTLDHTKRPVMTFTRPDSRVTSRPGEERRGGVIMGAEESITQHYTGQTFSTVYTSSTNKVCSLSQGCCSIAPCSSIWISWPSTTRRDCWTVFHGILSHCPTFSC